MPEREIFPAPALLYMHHQERLPDLREGFLHKRKGRRSATGRFPS
jgi:hypothetical protein